MAKCTRSLALLILHLRALDNQSSTPPSSCQNIEAKRPQGTLARQGISFRGHEVNKGGIKQILHLVERSDCEFLQEWLAGLIKIMIF